MTVHGWIAVATLAGAAVLFLTRKLPLGVTALLIPVVLLVTGVLESAQEALQGFGSQAAIAIGAIFVVGAGLEQSGVAGLLARCVRRAGGGSETRLVFVVCVAVASLSAFMPNAGTVAMLLPAMAALSRNAGVPAARLFMPLSYSALLGGTLTLIGTAPNLLVSDYLRLQSGHPFEVLDFARVGVPITLAGILFLAFAAPRMLKDRPREKAGEETLPEDLARSYGLTESFFRMRVTPQSPLCGKTIEEADISGRYALSLVILIRPANLGSRYLQPLPSETICAGDQLYLEGDDEDAWMLAEDEALQPGIPGRHIVERVLRHGITFAEVAPAPRSEALGESLKDLDFRHQTGLNILALWRRGQRFTGKMAYSPLELGDHLLVAGEPRHIHRLGRDPDWVLVSGQAAAADLGRSPLALGLLGVAVVPPLLGWLPLAVSALASAVLMVATRCVTFRRAEQAIDWKVLMLIVGTLPLGQALEKHGVASHAAQALVSALSGLGPAGVLAALFAAAMGVSVTASNAAAAVVLSPVAASAAAGAGIPAEHALLAVAYGCSCSFMTPFTQQCNLLVLGPGGYRPRDFLLVGGLMSLIVGATAVTGLALL